MEPLFRPSSSIKYVAETFYYAVAHNIPVHDLITLCMSPYVLHQSVIIRLSFSYDLSNEIIAERPIHIRGSFDK